MIWPGFRQPVIRLKGDLSRRYTIVRNLSRTGELGIQIDLYKSLL